MQISYDCTSIGKFAPCLYGYFHDFVLGDVKKSVCRPLTYERGKIFRLHTQQEKMCRGKFKQAKKWIFRNPYIF